VPVWVTTIVEVPEPVTVTARGVTLPVLWKLTCVDGSVTQTGVS
jgi:hypothetical protein